MIILITGDFGVGKDTFADMLLNYFGEEATKILSYTTRAPRYDGEDTHIFVSEEEWNNIKQNDNIIAETWIDNSYYGTIEEQFDNKYNIYVVDDIGVRDVLNANIDKVFIAEIVRPKWCMDIDTDRLSRKRHTFQSHYH